MGENIMPSQYDFTFFLERIKDMSYLEMLSTAEKALVSAENKSRGRQGGLHARQQGSLTFIKEVGEFIFFLKTGIKPFSVSEFNWPLYQTPMANLVQKGQMKPSILSIFEDVNKRQEE